MNRVQLPSELRNELNTVKLVVTSTILKKSENLASYLCTLHDASWNSLTYPLEHIENRRVWSNCCPGLAAGNLWHRR